MAFNEAGNVRPAADAGRLAKLALGAVVVYALLRPLLAFGHELTLAALATILHFGVGTGVWEPLIRLVGLDPIYTGAAMRAVGGVQVAGFAVAAPLGSVLHAILPAVFLACERVADGAGVSMVAAPGAPALGRGLASFGADVLWLTVGLWLFWRWRVRDWRVALVGLLVQAQIAVNHLLEVRVALADLDASGLPRAVQLADPNGGWFTDGLATWPEPLRGMVFGLSLLVLGYATAALLLWVAHRLHRRLDSHPRARTQPAHTRWSGAMKWSSVLAGAAVAFAVACSPLGDLGVGSTNWDTTAGPIFAVSASGIRITTRHNEPPRATGPTPVSVVHQPDGSWQYVVAGMPETIRGVGYNPWYAGLSPSQRTSLYDRDFSAMYRLGINTIDGWFENQFDSVTLDAAERNGIGVLMPFELNQDLDYTDPAVRANILERLSAYVEQYRNHPAVRMWAPGNENLHRILFAHWVSQLNDPAARARAQAMAAFLPVVVDRIHELDPNHPIVYRDADDEYLSWITSGFEQAGGERPWLVYGANAYTTPQLQEVISAWPTQWPGHPLLISEFAPGGVSPSQRALGFDQLWKVIRSRPDVVLGGLAYTWATNGPEDLDRVFGLVDPDGVPTDGALAALSYAYLSDSSALADAPGNR
ncbi:MAG TPA: glycoside hydrolase family 2 TIM barrel-domain containing protein [Chloroflexota bacterium]